jgi:hypothetical protein
VSANTLSLLVSLVFWKSLAGCIVKRLLDKRFCVTKAFQAIDGKLNVPNTPVSDPRYISGEGHRRIKTFRVSLHPNPKTSLLQVSATENALFE